MLSDTDTSCFMWFIFVWFHFKATWKFTPFFLCMW